MLVVAVVEVVVVLVVVIVVVTGHSGQPLQNQLLQALCHPPYVDRQTAGKHCPTVVELVSLVPVVTVVMFVVVVDVIYGHSAQDVQNH